MVILTCSFYHSFQGILKVHFGEIGWLNTLAVCYATASKPSQPQARLDLIIDCYLWAFCLYQQDRAHIQHCWIILASFSWCGFAIGISNRTWKERNPDGEPSQHRTKNTKPQNAYDIVKYIKDFESGCTIMKMYGDPQAEMYRIGAFLMEVFHNAQLVNLAVSQPKQGNITQIHDKIMKKLHNMAHAQRRNTHIGCYPIPFCCETTTLSQMYTTEELCTAGIITAMGPSASHVGSGWPASYKFDKSDITDMDCLHDVFEESTNTEMACCTHTILMITSDRKKVRLEALVKEQDHAINEAIWQVQERHLEEMQAINDAVHHREDEHASHKCHSASQKEGVKRTREESRETGSVPQEKE